MTTPIDTHAALQYFHTTDPVMATLVERALIHPEPIRLPTPIKPTEYFARIVQSIISQQISTHAARTIHQRLQDAVGTITTEQILATSTETLRACGISPQKIKYIRYNAEYWPTVPTEHLATLPDEAVITELTKLHGIGRWTAEMFLLFSLARPDIFSTEDLGLMHGLYAAYPGHKPHHVRKIAKRIESWSPHRSLAALTLWHYRDTTKTKTA